MDFRLGKEYKLCSKIAIDEVFSSGTKVKSFPFVAFVLNSNSTMDTEMFKILISVPKKKIKKAHDRNYIKRSIREGIRLNKQSIIAYAESLKCVLHISIVYIWNDKNDGKIIQEEIKKLINKICTSN